MYKEGIQLRKDGGLAEIILVEPGGVFGYILYTRKRRGSPQAWTSTGEIKNDRAAPDWDLAPPCQTYYYGFGKHREGWTPTKLYPSEKEFEKCTRPCYSQVVGPYTVLLPVEEEE